MAPLRRSSRVATAAAKASTPSATRSLQSKHVVTPAKAQKGSRKELAGKAALVAMAAASPSTAAALVTPRKQSPKQRTASSSPRTESFDAMWAGKFGMDVPVHTLILGTHPSIKSLKEEQYYGHPLNAFWWIVGDCLGFRRASGISPTTGEPYKFTSDVRYGQDSIIPYDEQVERLASHGFALWDVVKSCERKGSLDADIQREEPNDICGFCAQHPSIRRIVLTNGQTGSTLFNRHFKEWWKSGELMPAPDVNSQKAFGKSYARHAPSNNDDAHGSITCISAISVSPAAASFSYKQKRDFWEQHVYKPGLKDYEQMKRES